MVYKKISSWAADDRPREKFEKKGASALSDTELMAILIRTGSKSISAVDLARETLSAVNYNLHDLGKLSVKELTKIKGVGKAKAVTILAALELGRRRKLLDIPTKKVITASADVYDVFCPVLADLPHEEIWALYLNRANKIIWQERLSQGGISASVFDVRIAMKVAVERLATSIILCHNHPSGSKKPSRNDKEITDKLKAAAALIDVALLDHVIIAENNYFSFADEGLM